MKTSSRYRWFVVAIFFIFMLLHQADKLLIGPLTSPIMENFKITRTQMGLVTTGALIVGGIFYPLWGYLFDRYARAKLLALASLIWGSTTWLSAIAPTYPLFVATRASTGVDDSSYPGLYSLVSDYFPPAMRGKVNGLLQFTQPIGYLMGMLLGLFLADSLGWRGVFYFTGALGVILAVVIFFSVREPPRGQSEPELADLEQTGQYRFNWPAVRDLFSKPSLRLLFVQGFFGVFPWNAITYWFFAYLETERGYASDEIFITMLPAILIMAMGYPLGGAVGDYFYKRSPSGRALVAMVGVLAGAFFLMLTLSVPLENRFLFMILLSLTALFMPVAAPNVVSTVYDVTLPEVRSTALSVQYFLESSGAALTPVIVGLIADRSSLKFAFLLICTFTWLLCGVFFFFVARYVKHDSQQLHQQLQQRAKLESGKA